MGAAPLPLVRSLGRALTMLGIAMVSFTVLAYLDGVFAGRAAIAAFEHAEAAVSGVQQPSSFEITPDQSLWSTSAKSKYAAALQYERVPTALLSIDRLALEVPVFIGTDPITLNRGAGVVDGTARPGESGNIAISGHRDGFFRALEGIAPGDVIVLRTLQRTQRYVVSEIRIVDPLDVSVLDPTVESSLTLITCYPFRYVGYAPDRFVVRARAAVDPPSSET
jgi:sortase A